MTQGVASSVGRFALGGLLFARRTQRTGTFSRWKLPAIIVGLVAIPALSSVLLGTTVAADHGAAAVRVTFDATEGNDRRMFGFNHDVCYLEIVTKDVASVAAFYGAAYGWQFAPAAPELGNAMVAELPGGSLCGIRAPMHDLEKPIVRTYLRVVNIDEAIRQAAELGATVALEPMEIPGRGKVAIYFIGGIEQGLWQVP